MKKIALVGAYGYWNYGDDLLAYIFADYIKKWWPNSTLLVSSPLNSTYSFELIGANEVCNITSPYYWAKNPSKIKDDYIVLFGGGGILYDYPIDSKLGKLDPRRASAIFYIFASLIGGKKKKFAHGIGVGPLKSNYSRVVSKWFLNSMRYMTVRDSGSLKYVEELTREEVSVIPDPSFILAQSQELIVKETEKKIGLVLRKWHFADKEDVNEEYIYHLIQRLEAETGATVIPISLRTDELNSIYDRKVINWDPRVENPIEFAKFLGSFTMIISMRLHAINVAACFGVPSIAIKVDPKLEISANMLGLKDYTINNIENLDDILVKTKKMIKDKDLSYKLLSKTYELSKEVAMSFEALKQEVEKCF